jgi:hypothetical protein
MEKTTVGVQAKLEAQSISCLSRPQAPRAAHIKIVVQIAHKLCFLCSIYHENIRRYAFQ